VEREGRVTVVESANAMQTFTDTARVFPKLARSTHWILLKASRLLGHKSRRQKVRLTHNVRCRAIT